MGLRHTFGACYTFQRYGQPMIDTPTWDQFMAGSGFIDVLARFYAHPFVSTKPNVDVEYLNTLLSSEENLRRFLADRLDSDPAMPPDKVNNNRDAFSQVMRRSRVVSAVVELLEWWGEYQTGTCPTGTYRLRSYLKRAKAHSTGPLTVEDLDGSKLPTPTLEEVYEICWGYLGGQKELDQYNLLVKEKKERMATMGEGAGEDAGIDGWKKYVTKTIQP